jgi:acetylornithine deacetylase/succinyl-diaminopimelate desuccinylase-like protein
MKTEIESRAVEHLKTLLRINTSNPPGNESEAVGVIAQAVRGCGLEPVVLARDPRRANCVVRLKGSGERSALLLNAHLDVVPASREMLWRHPPFAGREEDGMIWGRGAVDMKHMAAMMLALLEDVSGRTEKLRGDLVFAWTADEERGGEYGARFLVEKHADLLQAEFGVGEVGGFPVNVAGESFVIVQTAEKGICWFRLRARGPSGHGSMPDPNSSVVKLSRAVTQLGAARLPVHLTKTTDHFMRRIFSRLLPEFFGNVGEMVVSPHVVGRLLKLMPSSPVVKGLWPMMANTATPTILEAGESPNVIPDEASVVVDGRTLPGQTSEDFLREVRRVVGDDLDIDIIQEAGPLEVSPDTEFFRHIEGAVKRRYPAFTTVPYLNPGFTDGKWFSKLGLVWYGFTPLLVDREPRVNVSELVHAVNERVPVQAVRSGARVLLDLVSSWAL